MTQRVTITLDDETAAALDDFMARRGYDNRSEAVRDLLHGGLARAAEEAGEVHVMFNNNRDDDAPTAATRMRALLGQEPPGPPEGEQMRLDEA